MRLNLIVRYWKHRGSRRQPGEDDVCYMVGYDGAICLPRSWIKKVKRLDTGYYVVEKLPDIGEWHCSEFRGTIMCYMEPKREWLPLTKTPKTPEEYSEYDVAWHVAHGYVVVTGRE